MTTSVATQRVFVPVIVRGTQIATQRVFVPVVDGALNPGLGPATGRRRQMPVSN